MGSSSSTWDDNGIDNNCSHGGDDDSSSSLLSLLHTALSNRVEQVIWDQCYTATTTSAATGSIGNGCGCCNSFSMNGFCGGGGCGGGMMIGSGAGYAPTGSTTTTTSAVLSNESISIANAISSTIWNPTRGHGGGDGWINDLNHDDLGDDDHSDSTTTTDDDDDSCSDVDDEDTSTIEDINEERSRSSDDVIISDVSEHESDDHHDQKRHDTRSRTPSPTVATSASQHRYNDDEFGVVAWRRPSFGNLMAVVQNDIHRRLKVLTVRQTSLSVSQAYSLGYGISNNSTCLEEVSIQNTTIPDMAAKAFANGLSGTKKNIYATTMVAAVAARHHSLKQLDLSQSKMNDIGISYIIGALTNKNGSECTTPAMLGYEDEGLGIVYSKLTSIVLVGVHAGPKTVQALSLMLQRGSNLQSLDLSDGKLPVLGQISSSQSFIWQSNTAAAAASVAIGGDIFQDNFMVDNGVQQEPSSVPPSHQLQLLLQQHQRGGGARRHPLQGRTMVKTRQFGLCNVSSLAAKMLRPSFATLQRLNLIRNGLNDEDMINLSKAMSSTDSVLSAVEELNVGFNNITDVGIVQGLAKHLPTMFQLKHLALNPNPFSKQHGGQAIVHALQHSNFTVEYIDTLFCLQSPILCNDLRYYTNLNRGGRRILHANRTSPAVATSGHTEDCDQQEMEIHGDGDDGRTHAKWGDCNDIPISLWPTLLARISRVKYHSVTGGYCSDDASKRIKLDVMYHLISNAGPTMFSMAKGQAS